ncbi:LacI family DNA-binding transcriptional regulator [Actinotignum schaalii]|uniref:LacI family DNA-binding transcriptional regulator n=1 Tax=Actinotignum schaalii TaxID=59505 RepID=UPI00237E152E|nr:LacI family DNA-binding transcriptional regulator [Actinotignum schaalii]MDE1654811.1 LacI family DNA-binding transcriptional regulator [Actinotignum schaalii]
MSKSNVQSARVTLHDVAAKTGLSRATVSKALNDRPDVSVATRLAVRTAAEELGYLRSTQGGPSTFPHIALVSDSLKSPYTMEVISGAAVESQHMGFGLTVWQLDETPDGSPSTPRAIEPLSEDWLRLIASRGYVGIVLVTAPISEDLVSLAEALNIPIVSVDSPQVPPKGVRELGATNWRGGKDATGYLFSLGHRRIAFVSGPPRSVPSQDRMQGYLSAYQIADVVVDDKLIVEGGFTFESGFTAGRQLFTLPRSQWPTAVFAASDQSALGVIEAARATGLRVPRDLSVIGFDDTLMAWSSSPQLTTVRQPIRQLGALSIRTLSDARKGIDTGGALQLTTELIVRGTTAPAPEPL